MDAGHIALIYKKRWQIELLFKQLKQNFPLKYFLGDNENAIKIQIWCTLIVNLLLTVIRKQLKRKWSFSNLASFCRLHLFNYIHLMNFLENPEKDWIKEEDLQLKINFNSG
jgi:IS4 transposase